MNYILLIGVIALVSMGGMLALNITSFENQVPYPSHDDIYQPWNMETRSDTYKDVANPYASYRANWMENVNLPPWMPASLLIGFFGCVAYLFYYDWRNEPKLEMFGRYGGCYEV